MVRIPKKLKCDPIIEALLEIRFESDEVSEIIIGKLASNAAWSSGTPSRTPFADIPEPIRAQTPELKTQPTLEIKLNDTTRVVKIGERVLSFHAHRPYPGWAVFHKELEDTATFVFSSLRDIRPVRIGFRYVNAFTSADHSINSVDELNVRIQVANQLVKSPLNLNYGHSHSDAHRTLVRIASSEFVKVPAMSPSAVVDIDVFTPPSTDFSKGEELHRWIADAHLYLKEEFFNLFTDDMFDNLVEEW